MAVIDNSNKTIEEPWSYKPNYDLTFKLLNSNASIAKVAKYTGVILAVLVLAEAIKNIVAIPLKVLGNLFGLYKYPMFKTPRMEKITDKKSRDTAQKNLVWKKALYVAGAILGLTALVYGGIKLYPYMQSILTITDDETTNSVGGARVPSGRIHCKENYCGTADELKQLNKAKAKAESLTWYEKLACKFKQDKFGQNVCAYVSGKPPTNINILN